MSLDVLIGGGRDEARLRSLLAPFVAATGQGEVLCVVVDDGEGVDLDRWRGVLADAADVRCVVLTADRPLRPDDVAGAAGVFVAGGLTPLYAELVVPAGAALAPLPYAGFSAGAAVAAERALVGGWRIEGRPVCPDDAAEDLDEVTVVAGLGRVGFAADVHAAQWGTTSRALHAVAAGLVGTACAIDEHTAVLVRDGAVEVTGAGFARWIDAAGVRVEPGA